MIADFGFAAVLIAFLSAVYAAVAGVVGGRRNDERWITSARNASVATFPLLLLASDASARLERDRAHLPPDSVVLVEHRGDGAGGDDAGGGELGRDAPGREDVA